jgi:propanol-preferring alcohol dehydrogenase
MQAMILRRPGKYSSNSSPLELADVATPSAGDAELLVRVSFCGVCRTDLDVAEGRVVAPQYPVTPGHQIIGHVAARGRGVSRFKEGDRVGVAWINYADGTCRWCRAGLENLCPQFRSTGCDVDGGYAEYVVVPAQFAHAIPNQLTDVDAAPLMCAGAVGWRSLRLTRLSDGETLGLSGFGASAHLVLQMARRRFPASPIYVFARDQEERAFAIELGATWAGNFMNAPPQSIDAVIDTTPVWKPLVELLPRLAPGGRFVINAIRKSSADQNELLRLDYASHLWMEREIKSVANVTREDVRQMLELAAETGLHPTVEVLPLDHANEALGRLSGGMRLRGAMVLSVA